MGVSRIACIHIRGHLPMKVIVVSVYLNEV